MSGIRVLLVHEYELARRGLRRMLEDHDDIEVVGEASNAVEALGQAEQVSPDVILIDTELPHISGLETIRILKERGLPGAVVMLSPDAQNLAKAARLGAQAYLVEEVEADDLASVIRQVPQGGFVLGASLMNSTQGREMALRYFSEQQAQPGQRPPEADAEMGIGQPEGIAPGDEATEDVVAQAPDAPPGKRLPLTQDEKAILQVLAKGASDKAIASRLDTTEVSARAQVSKLRHKLGLASRRDMVTYAKGGDTTPDGPGIGSPGPAAAVPAELRAEAEATVDERGAKQTATVQPDTGTPEETGEKPEVAEGSPSALRRVGTTAGEVELVIPPTIGAGEAHQAAPLAQGIRLCRHRGNRGVLVGRYDAEGDHTPPYSPIADALRPPRCGRGDPGDASRWRE